MDSYLVKQKDIVLEQLDCGEGNDLKIMDVVAQAQGAPFTFGVVEMEQSKGVEFDYDDDGACCILLEGNITLEENISGESMSYEPGDIVYIPQKKGLVVTWKTDSYAKFAFVTYPHWR
jgi:ethanolamine utilization protein EutQ (cupin superfamily)